jgi:hypothetical protein
MRLGGSRRKTHKTIIDGRTGGNPIQDLWSGGGRWVGRIPEFLTKRRRPRSRNHPWAGNRLWLQPRL